MRPSYLLVVILSVPNLCWASAIPGHPPVTKISTGHHVHDQRHRNLEEAKGVAEAETGGEAVAAHWVELGGTQSSDGKGGIEVQVHMSGKANGWRCTIDSNTMKLRKKEPIPNPASKVR